MLIIKSILFFFIFLSSTYIGILISNKYKNRVKDLKEFKSFINIINTKIRYTYEPIGEICEDLSKMSDSNIGKLFYKFGFLIKDKSITKSWEEAIDEYGENFSKEDKTIIKTLGRMLGKTDVEGQASELEQFQEFLKMQIEKAEKDKQKNEKLYKSLGMVIGLAIIIILI
ncbi:MAG: stage III sporulation protein AB [Clostridia bacterium]|nr:stage III sporulation protein AB [Clostridia bacterium]